LKVKAYEQFVDDQARMPILDLDYSVLGLCGEAGEVAEWVKKRVHRGNDKFTDEMLLSELGDVLYYITRIAHFKDWSLKDIMKYNVKKLKERG
jgi:NTP pyrophosphatase (non-canonical NTP hydrolase)